MSFSELGLSPKVLAAIEAAGYTTPTPIQARAIPIAVSGKDVLGIAQTGTGKTASFVLPMLTRLETGRARARMPRSLILCPTRELATQVAENFERYGTNHKLTVALLIGGVSFDEQNRKLDRGSDVLIATPGRLLDHFGRGRLLMTGVEILVIDEADRMLDMGFIPDIEKICSFLPPTRQTLFFSATMPAEIQRLVDRFLRSPERIEVAPQSTTAATITQRFRFTTLDPKAKREALRDWIRTEDVKNAIIFCNRKKDVDILYKSLMKHGLNAGCLHGDMDQRNRTATLDAFRAGTIALLAASDVAARGLDIPEVSHVFNYDVPLQAEDYVHRIGRTGRAGRKGFAATLVTDNDMQTLREIEKMLKKPLEWVDGEPPEDAGTKEGRRRRAAPARDSDDRGRGHRHERAPRRSDERPAETRGEAEPRRPAAEATESRRSEGRRRERPEGERRSKAPRPEVAADAERQQGPQRQPSDRQPRRDDRRRQPPREREREGGPAVVGMGDHLPEFMRRPVRPANEK